VSGLLKSRTNLAATLARCSDHSACRSFLRDYRPSEDLVVAPSYLGLSFTSTNHGVTNSIAEISDLLSSGLVEEVEAAAEVLEEVEQGLEREAREAAPQVKEALRQMGRELEQRAQEVGGTLGQVTTAPLLAELPKLDQLTERWVEWRYYLGLGMASALLLVLIFFVLGLFYGLCGKRPGGLYGDDCCNRGTGASLLATACHLTFLLSLPLLLLTSLHFLLGSSLQHGLCTALTSPADSDVFRELDRSVLSPGLVELLGGGGGADRGLQVLRDCHANKSLYSVLHMGQVYNISHLAAWRDTWSLASPLLTLAELPPPDLSSTSLLPPAAASSLQHLATSSLATLDTSSFSSLSSSSPTEVDLTKVVRRLRTLREQLARQEAMRKVANELELEVRWLEGMATVAQTLELTARRLEDRLSGVARAVGGVLGEEEEEEEGEGEEAPLSSTLPGLVAAAGRAEATLRSSGGRLVAGLRRQLAREVGELVDSYTARVVRGVEEEVGACAPVSEAYNATVSAVCDEVVKPFNAFWASIGWCYLLYLPCILLSVSLIKLYRQTEPYPGPVAEAEVQPLDGRQGSKARRQHRRTRSSCRLPELTHSRALPALPPDEEGQAPPQYSSNPSLPRTEYER